jgi:hypothetical protein
VASPPILLILSLIIIILVLTKQFVNLITIKFFNDLINELIMIKIKNDNIQQPTMQSVGAKYDTIVLSLTFYVIDTKVL